MEKFYLGRNAVQYENYSMVQTTKQTGRHLPFDINKPMVGYLYYPNGRYTKHYLESGADNIAKFFCSSTQDKLLCNGDDIAIACSMADYLDLAVEELREAILPYMRKYQASVRKPDFEEKK